MYNIDTDSTHSKRDLENLVNVIIGHVFSLQRIAVYPVFEVVHLPLF